MCSSKCFAKPQKVTLKDILKARSEFGEAKGLETIEVADLKILKEDFDYISELVLTFGLHLEN